MVSNKVQTRLNIMHSVFTDSLGAKTLEKTKLDRVKTALSALGFGCSHSTSPKGALARAFRGGAQSEERVRQFLLNPLVQELIMGNEVLQHLLEKEYSQTSGLLDRERIELQLKKPLEGSIPKNSTKPRQLSDSTVLRKLESHLYQEWESQVIADLQQSLHGRVLLHVHDCVYTDLPLSGVADLTYTLIAKWDMQDRPYAETQLWKGCGKLFGENKGSVGTAHSAYRGKIVLQSLEKEWTAKLKAEELAAQHYVCELAETSSELPNQGISERRMAEALIRPSQISEPTSSADYYGGNYFKDTYGASSD
jgi:hypothetical protein